MTKNADLYGTVYTPHPTTYVQVIQQATQHEASRPLPSCVIGAPPFSYTNHKGELVTMIRRENPEWTQLYNSAYGKFVLYTPFFKNNIKMGMVILARKRRPFLAMMKLFQSLFKSPVIRPPPPISTVM